MAFEDTAIGMPTLDVSFKGPPVRIVLHIQPDLQRNSEINLRTKRLKIVDAFFEWTKLHALNREYTYVHFSTEHELQSWVLIDACTGAIPEGSAPNSIPILLYIVSKEKEGLVFKKARSSPLILENIRSNTDKVPWKAEWFFKLPIDHLARKESNIDATSQVPRWKNYQTWSSASHIFESGIEAKLRQNISCTEPDETAIQPDPTTPLNIPVSHLSLLNIPIRSQDRPIRVLLQISNDDPLGDLREQCTVASKAFLKCMMGDEYQKTITTYLIRAMNLFVKSEMETWMLVDYWVGLSKGTGKPPLLTMTYRGEMLDGRMKFQPTKLGNMGGQATCSMFLTRFHLARKYTAVTVEGVELASESDYTTSTDLNHSLPQVQLSAASDGLVSGDWAVLNHEVGSGLSSWEFVGGE